MVVPERTCGFSLVGGWEWGVRGGLPQKALLMSVSPRSLSVCVILPQRSSALYCPFLFLLDRSSFYGRCTPIFQETNCVCNHFQFPCCFGSHILYLTVDLVYITSCNIQTAVQLPMLGIFNLYTGIKHAIARGGYMTTVRVCTECPL